MTNSNCSIQGVLTTNPISGIFKVLRLPSPPPAPLSGGGEEHSLVQL